ncbi:MAG: type IV toxin-antitoxin system AbiEi family antitoxin domain-containing protein [Actinomycetota bacterium]
MAGIPGDVRELLRRHDGVLLTADAKKAGVSESRLSRLAASGRLERAVHGAYVDAEVYAQLDEWQRFAMRARAFGLLSASDSFLTGWACTVIRGYPTLGRPPRLATVVRPKGTRRWSFTGTSGRVLVADLPEEHRCRLGWLPVVSDEWAVVDLARTARLPDSLVVADEAARRGCDLAKVLPQMGHWVGINRANWVVAQAVPTVESPLETLGRFAFLEHGLPMPVTNAWVGRDGPQWRLDGLLPWHWWGYEGDGALKYDNRADASQIVQAQQEREFQLRRLGLDLLRYGWPDAYPRRRALADKVLAMFADHPPQSEPVRWWKDVPGYGPVEPAQEDWPSPCPAGIVLPAGWERDIDDLRSHEGDQVAGAC